MGDTRQQDQWVEKALVSAGELVIPYVTLLREPLIFNVCCSINAACGRLYLSGMNF